MHYEPTEKERIIIIHGYIDDSLASNIIQSMLKFLKDDSTKKIYVLIDSQGGKVTSIMAIYDTIHYLSCEVVTIALKYSYGLVALLLAAGNKGRRYICNNSEISLFFDFKTNGIAIDEVLKDNSNRINNIIDKLLNCFSENTALDIEKVRVLSSVDTKLSAKNILEDSLADKVLDINIPIESKFKFSFIDKLSKDKYYDRIIKELKVNKVIDRY
ncbi:ATP-dependent Clp protease proteolytic subunit [Clostridium sp. C8-1-8]|uniref:ClpP family protease n=1 Tax=Clostridium sp. C8-1-8 TaxID=2698831 RepID=UPI0013706FAE|nr:ATP-dependent Clp protease proteolytic subunit [Clostridium sp. C8-1-8]